MIKNVTCLTSNISNTIQLAFYITFEVYKMLNLDCFSSFLLIKSVSCLHSKKSIVLIYLKCMLLNPFLTSTMYILHGLFIYLSIFCIRTYACVSRFLARPSITLRISFHRITFMFVIPPFRLTFVCFDEATLWRTLRWFMGGGDLPCLQDWLEHSMSTSYLFPGEKVWRLNSVTAGKSAL